MTLCACSSSGRSGVSRRSGFFGRWYGLSIPVKCVISPARALAYSPLGSRCSHSASGVSQNTSTKSKPGVGVHFAGQLAVLGQRTDRRHQHDLAGVGQQRRDVRQPAQVLGTVGHA